MYRFGQHYVVLQEGSESLDASKVSTFKPDLTELEHNQKEFHPEYVHKVIVMIVQVIHKHDYC